MEFQPFRKKYEDHSPKIRVTMTAAQKIEPNFSGQGGSNPVQKPDAATAPIDPAVLASALRAALPHQPLPEKFTSVPGGVAKARIPSIAVIIPCFNEAPTIESVINGFRAVLPGARITVFDNNSTDNTAAVARDAGAEVFFEPRRGKGNVVRRMFAEIDADVYLMVDGDGTYDPGAAADLVSLVVNDRVDMAIGTRANVTRDAHRAGHALGNRLFNDIFARMFGQAYADIFSGYRAFSRRFVKSFPALSSGFEIETELSVHASQMRLPVAEIETAYSKRPDGSHSKLRSVRDGLRILHAFVFLLKETRPILFFGMVAAAVSMLAGALALPLLDTYFKTGLVPRQPTAILCMGLMVVASLLAVCGIVLDSLTRARVEHKRILYLAVENLTEHRKA